MHIVSIIIAVVIVFTGVYFSQRNRVEVVDQGPADTLEVLSEAEDQEEQQQEQEEIQPIKEPDPTTTSSPIPLITPIPFSLNLSGYRYPNSQAVSSSDNSLLLNSTDDTDKITDWYKERIKVEGMGAKTFVKTKTNDNVLNKLVGADSEKEIRVEITKESDESVVKISVKVSSSN